MLADRVGIIDHGKIVAEGTPAALKAEIGRPTRRGGARAIPTQRGSRRDVLGRFGERARRRPQRRAPSGSRRRRASLADVVRALDAEGIAIANLQLHAPTLDDVFLARPAARSRAPSEAEAEAEDAARRGEPSVERRPRAPRRQLARRSVVRTLRQPAKVVPALDLPAVPARGQRRRPRGGDQPPRLPDRLLPHLRARRALHPGRALRGDRTPAPTWPGTSRPASSTAWR